MPSKGLTDVSTPEETNPLGRLRPQPTAGLPTASLVMLVEAVGAALVAAFLTTHSLYVTAIIAATVVACLAVAGHRG